MIVNDIMMNIEVQCLSLHILWNSTNNCWYELLIKANYMDPWLILIAFFIFSLRQKPIIIMSKKLLTNGCMMDFIQDWQ